MPMVEVDSPQGMKPRQQFPALCGPDKHHGPSASHSRRVLARVPSRSIVAAEALVLSDLTVPS